MKKVVGVIPARYASKRFPGKVLAPLLGKPVIQHVYERAKQVGFPRLLVATDDPRIQEVVKGFGGEVVMTSPHHLSGTDRVAEAIENIPCEIIINLQGDEPLLSHEAVRSVITVIEKDPSLQMATLITQIKDQRSKIKDQNVVKVVLDPEGYILSFSRTTNHQLPITSHKIYKHIGIYAYRKETLLSLTSLPQTPMEMKERLEQWRALENGIRIKGVYTPYSTQAVDTPEDLKEVEKILNHKQ